MAKKYRVRLANDRVVGPFTAKQIGELFNKGHLEGEEACQIFPGGDWKTLKAFKELNEIIVKLIKGEATTHDFNTDENATVVRLNIGKIRKEEKKKKAKQERNEKIKKLEKIEKEAQKKEHQEFQFKKETQQVKVDYDELEKKYQEKKSQDPEPEKVPEPEDDSGVEKTVVLKRPVEQKVEKTLIVNPQVLEELKEDLEKTDETEEEVEAEEEQPKEEKEEEISTDESTQFVNLNELMPTIKEEVELEEEKIKEAALLEKHSEPISKSKKKKKKDEEEDDPSKKKMKPIVAFAFLALLYFLFVEDDKPAKNAINPKTAVFSFPVTLPQPNPTLSKDLLIKGVEQYRRGTYETKIIAADYFNKSIEAQYEGNDALGYLLLTYAELLPNAADKRKAAETLFSLVKIARSKVLTDINVAMGTALFYGNANKVETAVLTVENFLRLGKPSKKMFGIYLDLLTRAGMSEKARKVYLKLEGVPDKPVEAFLAMAKFNEFDQQFADGKKVILEGLKTNVTSVALLLELAGYLLREQNFKNYTDVLKKIKLLKAENSPIFYARYLEYMGILAAYNKNSEQAAILFKLALTIHDSPELRSKLAAIEVDGGKAAQALILESKAVDLIRESQKSAKERKWEDAFNAALQAADMNDKFIPGQLNFAAIQVKRGYFASAIKRLEELRNDFKQNWQISYALTDAYIEAMKLVDAQIEINNITNSQMRNRPEYHSLLGRFYAKSKKWRQAVFNLNESIKKNPLRDQDYFLMAKIFLYNRRYDEAKKQLSEAINLDPSNIIYRSLYAQILFELTGAETAIGYLRDLLKDNKENPKIMGDIAIYYYKNGQVAQFEEMKKNIEDLRSSDADFYEFLIKSAKLNDKNENVIKYSKELLKVNPGDVDTWITLGNYLAEVGRYRQALEAFDSVKTRLESYPRINYYIGKVHLMTKRYKQAIKSGEEEIKRNPTLYNGYFIAGVAHKKLGKIPEALKYLETAVSKDPNNVESLIELGEIKISQNYYELAREYFLRALRREQNNPRIHKQLGIIFENLGQSTLSIEYYETYLKLDPGANDRAVIESSIRRLRR